MRPPELLAGLSARCQELVAEIEGASGLQIEVLSYAASAARSSEPIYGEIFPDTPASLADFDRAEVLFPGDANNLSAEQYHHELLHLQLALVGNAPTLVTPNAAFSQFAANINNQSDHLLMFPEIDAHNPNWRASELKALREFWKKFPPGGDPDVLRFYAAHRYHLTRAFTPELADEAKRKLRAAGLLQAAHQGAQALGNAGDKISLLRVSLSLAGEDVAKYRLRYVDVGGRRRVERAFP